MMKCKISYNDSILNELYTEKIMEPALFKDIQTINSAVIEKFFACSLRTDPIATYDYYRVLHNFKNSVRLVLIHYLGVAMESHFLQNSHYGTPLQKWRIIVNEDLDKATESAKILMNQLERLGHYTDDEDYNYKSTVSDFWPNAKQYYAYFNQHYSCGKVDEEGIFLHSSWFEIIQDSKPMCSVIVHEIDSYEKRQSLIDRTECVYKQLINDENLLRKYILEHFTSKELLLQIQEPLNVRKGYFL